MSATAENFIAVDTSRDDGEIDISGDVSYPGLELFKKLGFYVAETPDDRRAVTTDAGLWDALHKKGEDENLKTHKELLERVQEGSKWVERTSSEGTRIVRGRSEVKRPEDPRPSLAYKLEEGEELLKTFLHGMLTGDIEPKNYNFPIFLLAEGDKLFIAMNTRRAQLVDTPMPETLCRLFLGMLGLQAREGQIEIHRDVLERPLAESIARLQSGEHLLDREDVITIAERVDAFSQNYNDPGAERVSHMR